MAMWLGCPGRMGIMRIPGVREAPVLSLHLLFHPWPLQYLMEGSYNKVFLAKGNIPAESYTFFIDILLDTIRCVGASPLIQKKLDPGNAQP